MAKITTRNIKHRRRMRRGYIDQVGRLVVTWVDASMGSVMVGNRLIDLEG